MASLKTETTVIDQDGKRTINQKSFRIKTNTEEFYMTFIKHIAPVYNLRSTASINVLNFLCCQAEFNTGKVILPASKRKEFCDSIGIEKQTFSNAICELKKHNLIHGERGEYMIDPKIFWKGTTDERAKALNNETFNMNLQFTSNNDRDL
jgi:hypothetical protein